jgi:molybdenum cofactor synthesis domain-containing protein
MKPFGRLTSFDDALRLVSSNIKTIQTSEFVTLPKALGRVVAFDVVALYDIPPFDRASMDGFAVRAQDTFGSSRRNPKKLNVVGNLFAGQLPDKSITEGECLKIATGAVMPQGADAVVMIEDTKLHDGKLSILKAAHPFGNVANKGEDIKAGSRIIKKGEILTPGRIGMLSSQGLDTIEVFNKPKVSILSTGEEIVAPGKNINAGQVFDINSFTISSIVVQNGGDPIRLPICNDTKIELKSSIKKALRADMVIISGGSSVGERDLLSRILEEIGTLLFHGLQIKPGKPTLFALVENKPVFGMPGYPTSSLINSYLIIRPALRQMANLPITSPAIVTANLSEAIPGSLGRRQFLPVKITGHEVTPLFRGSGAITTTALADGYIIINEDVDNLAIGEEVKVFLFD